MKRAVFLDRDGVINKLVLNQTLNEYEAPQKEEDLELCTGAIDALKELIKMGYLLFIVSNQPDFAKGKTSLENLLLVHKKLHSVFQKNNVKFNEYYYCYHHPDGVVPEYSIICNCRKPGNFFLRQAESKHGLDLSNSWMIGDRDTDIYCGQSVGAKAIMVKQKHSCNKATQSKPEFTADSLKEAVDIIKNLQVNKLTGKQTKK